MIQVVPLFVCKYGREFPPFFLFRQSILVGFFPFRAVPRPQRSVGLWKMIDGSKVTGMVSKVTSGNLVLTFQSGGSQSFSHGEMESFHQGIGRRTNRRGLASVYNEYKKGKR